VFVWRNGKSEREPFLIEHDEESTDAMAREATPATQIKRRSRKPLVLLAAIVLFAMTFGVAYVFMSSRSHIQKPAGENGATSVRQG
jgi:hypothetical protein